MDKYPVLLIIIWLIWFQNLRALQAVWSLILKKTIIIIKFKKLHWLIVKIKIIKIINTKLLICKVMLNTQIVLILITIHQKKNKLKIFNKIVVVMVLLN